MTLESQSATSYDITKTHAQLSIGQKQKESQSQNRNIQWSKSKLKMLSRKSSHSVE